MRSGPDELQELARGIFEERIVTRGTEIDATATVSTSSFLRYFEHTRWCVMQRESLGLCALIDAGHFFVVRSQIVELRRRIGQGQPLILTTRFLDVGRSTATVVHEALRERDGAVVARAKVVGVWLGPTRRPARIPDSVRTVMRIGVDHDLSGDDEAFLEGTDGGNDRSFIDPPERVFAPLSVMTEPPLEPPSEPVATYRLVVPFRDLDVFSHVNAATFLHYADDARDAFASTLGIDPAVARGFVNRVGLFYQQEARQGDTLDLALVPLGRAALGVWCRRERRPNEMNDVSEGGDGDIKTGGLVPLVAMRLDLVAGADPVTTPS